MDESDGDVRMFLSYFLAAIQSLFPKTELSAELLLETNQKLSASVLARYLMNDIDQISEPCIIVLDDYHHIAGRSSVHGLLTEVLAHPPRTMHLVLLTRRDPPFSLVRLRSNGQVTEIRAADLCFSQDEVSAFFNERLKIPLDDATTRLHLRASNWLAENGLIDEAIRHAVAAGDTRTAVRLVLEHCYDLMNTAQYFTLNKWLAARSVCAGRRAGYAL